VWQLCVGRRVRSLLCRMINDHVLNATDDDEEDMTWHGKSAGNDRLGRLQDHHLLCKRIRLKMFRHFLNALSLAVIFFGPPRCRVFCGPGRRVERISGSISATSDSEGEMVTMGSLYGQTSKAFLLITLVTMDWLHLHQLASDLTDQHQLNGHRCGQVATKTNQPN
jgi:hypothetical protein